MYKDLYNDTDINNLYDFHDNNYESDYSRNDSCAPYINFNAENFPINYMELSCKVDKMQSVLCKLCKQSKKMTNHKKRKNKSHRNKTKKIEKRLKAIEKHNSDMMLFFTAILSQQTQTVDKYGWVKRTIENTAPHLVDLASNIAMTITQLPAKTPTLNVPATPCLPDKSNMK